MTKVIETHPELDELLKEFKTETVSEEALRLLSPISEGKWCTCTRLSDEGNSCALGHYNTIKYKDSGLLGQDGRMTLKLIASSNRFLNSNGCTIAYVNNWPCDEYPQSTPKQRVIALLKDMVSAGY